MNVSKVDDVGQMRSRMGISMKTMRKELTLRAVRPRPEIAAGEDLHAEGSKNDHDAEME